DGSIVVGVVDSGIDMDHPDLMGQLWTHWVPNDAPAGSPDAIANQAHMQTIHGANFSNTAGRLPCSLFSGEQMIYPCDAEGHGTAVASIIAAQTSNATGMAGVAWHAQLMSAKFLDDDTDRCLDTTCPALQNAALAVKYAADAGARILNLSWG